MAVLQDIRNKGPLLVVIIGLALLAFVLGDLLTSGNTFFIKARDKAFAVNGDVVSTQAFVDQIAEWENFQKTISGQATLDENTTMQIREAVYDQMVRQMILDNQTEKLGLTVSKEEINDLVHGQSISPILTQLPFFLDPQTRMFDKEALLNFLNTVNSPNTATSVEEQALVNQYKSMWLFIENMIKYQRLEEKYTSLLSSSVMVNDVEAKNNFDWAQQNADLLYVTKNYFTIPDSTISVTNNEIKAFYDKHKKMFRSDVPVAKVSFFTKEIVPSDTDFAEIETQANEAYGKLKEAQNIAPIVAEYSDLPYRDIYVAANLLNDGQQAFVETASIGDIQTPIREGNAYNIYKLIDKSVAPDSIHLRMMAIPDAMVGQDSVVTHFVDSIYHEITSGTPFADVAYSLNPQSNGGDIGWVREFDLASVDVNLVKVAFSSPIGQAVRLKVPGQQVILEVLEKTAPVQKYKIATINMPVIISEKTSNNADNELNQLVTNPEAGKKFNQLASELGYVVTPEMRVSANDFSLMQIPGSRQIVAWAVNEKKAGAVRKFDLTNLRVVARVDAVYPAGTTPLSEVSSSIRARLINEKKAEKIISDLSGKNLTSLEAYATEMNSRVDTVRFVNFNTQNLTGLGFEPAVNAQAAFAPVNQVSAPVKGNMGVMVTNVINRTQGSDTYDAAAQKQLLYNSNAYRFQVQAMESLKNKLKVEDNRYVMF